LYFNWLCDRWSC